MRFVFVAILFAVSCLTRPDVGGEKALHAHGGGKSERELRKDREKLVKERERERKEARKTFAKRCGSVLKDPRWWPETAIADGFFAYETKSLDCEDRQMVMIDVKAAHYLEASYLTCAKSGGKGARRFLLKIPRSVRTEHREILVDCNTRLLDIGVSEGMLHLATIESNGTTQKAVLDDRGRWDGTTTLIAQGLAFEQLTLLRERIEQFRREGTLGHKMEQLFLAVADYTKSAAKGAVIGAVLAVVGMGIAEAATPPEQGSVPGVVKAKVVIGVAAAGGLLAMGMESSARQAGEDKKLTKEEKESIEHSVLAMMREYVRRTQ